MANCALKTSCYWGKHSSGTIQRSYGQCNLLAACHKEHGRFLCRAMKKASEEKPGNKANLDSSQQRLQAEQPPTASAATTENGYTMQHDQGKQQQQQVFLAGGLSTKYQVPWDVWVFIQVTAAVWVVNQSIPFAVLSAAANLQGLEQIAELHVAEKEVLGLMCQFAQLACTYLIISTVANKHQPLPKPWFWAESGAMPVLQAFATSIAAVGSGLLLSGFMTGHVDGAEEWRHLAGLHTDSTGVFALVVGAIILAPLTEEYYFRGFVLPSLTKWLNPVLAVPVTGLLFASAHPADAFLPEAFLGSILSLSLLAADGNLLVPLLAHALYNSFVLGTEFLL